MQQLKRWPGIELRHLEALAVVVDEGSFRRAARKLGYTQSAISQQIAALERAVGHPVLERPSRGRPLALTEVGARLRRLHDTVEQAMAAARADVAAAAAGSGTSCAWGRRSRSRISPRRSSPCASGIPRVVVEVVSAVEDDRLLRLLETGAVDLAIVRSASVSPPVEVRPAAMCSYAVAIPSASSLARGQKRIALSDLSGLARIATADGTAFADDVAAPVVASDAEMALGLVGAGAGAAVLPALFASVAHPGVTVRPLRDILPAVPALDRDHQPARPAGLGPRGPAGRRDLRLAERQPRRERRGTRLGRGDQPRGIDRPRLTSPVGPAPGERVRDSPGPSPLAVEAELREDVQPAPHRGRAAVPRCVAEQADRVQLALADERLRVDHEPRLARRAEDVAAVEVLVDERLGVGVGGAEDV